MNNSMSTYTKLGDKLGRSIGPTDDDLNIVLRDLPGVPDASYVVGDDQRVFVFSKLEELVRAQISVTPDAAISEIVDAVIRDAFVSVDSAVRQWHITPDPFYAGPAPEGGIMLVHKAFGARISETFADHEATQNAKIALLRGDVYPSKGNFTFLGQSLMVIESFDPSELPPCPFDSINTVQRSYDYRSLENMTYREGFDPVSKTVFEDVKRQEYEWVSMCSVMHYRVGQRYNEVVKRLLSLNLISKWGMFTPDPAPDQTLFDLGKKVDGEFTGVDRHTLGKWIAYALLRGNRLPDAIHFARACAVYDRELKGLADRIRDAISFLGQRGSESLIHRRGGGISVRADIIPGGTTRSPY